MLTQPELPIVGMDLLGALVTIAAVYDMRFRRIPNWLVLAGIICGISYHCFVSGFSGLGQSMAGLGLGFILYFPLYLLRARGAGDVKLLAAVGAITGPGNCFWIFLLTAVFGGVIAMVILLIRGRVQKTLFNVSWIIRDMLRFRAPHQSSEELDVNSNKGMRLPHGALIFVGAAAFAVMVEFKISL